MAAAPNQSLPKQFEDWADLKAAYRFLNHDRVTPEGIQGSHRERVRGECRDLALVLAVQDTTELDFTGRHGVEGLGPIGDGRGQGMLQHSTLAVVPRGPVIGLLHQIYRNRVPAPPGETRRQRRERPKESDFWHESVDAVGSLGPRTRLIHVTDRGGDDFSMMMACSGHENVGFLIRAQHDRCVNGGTDRLWAFMAARPVVGHRDVPVPARAGQPKRIARLSVRFALMNLDPPKGDTRFQHALPVWAVYAREENPPENIDPIEWMLLSSEPVVEAEQAFERIDWYTCRWIIEEWHKAEKTGCRLEANQLKDAEAIQCLAAFVGVIAIRLLQLRDLAQMTTDAPGTQGSSADDPEVLRKAVPSTWILIVSRLAKCAMDQLTPRQFWLTIAKRGGHIGRKNDGPPGWLVIWRGWYDIMIMVQGAELALATHEASLMGKD